MKRPALPLADRFHHLFAMVLIWCVVAIACGCKPAKSPSAVDVAGMAVSSVGLGVKIADEWCLARAKRIYAEGDESNAIGLAVACEEQYSIARKALMAAAYAVDGWADAANHGKALCALTEAVSALTYVVQLLKEAGVAEVPREVSMGLAAVAVLSEMVEAKQCAMPAKAGK